MDTPIYNRRLPAHAPRTEARQPQERDYAAKPISFFATDGAIPLNFMPLPEEYDPDGKSTDGDIAVDRTLAHVARWRRLPRRFLARLLSDRG